jgi:hypothetical protein
MVQVKEHQKILFLLISRPLNTIGFPDYWAGQYKKRYGYPYFDEIM